jgi:hypothetical protein
LEEAVSEQAASLQKHIPLQQMTMPPDGAEERQNIGDQLWMGNVIRFQETLSEVEQVLWRNPPANISPNSQYARLIDKFDEYLVRECETKWGWRLLMSRDMLRRHAQWEMQKPELFEKMGHAMMTHARIVRGEEAAPLAEGVDLYADDAIEEMGRLLQLCRNEFLSRPVVRCERIAAFMKLTVDSRRSEFPHLYGDLGQLEGFVSNLPTINKEASQLLEKFDVRAEGFFTLFFATAHNRTVKDVQNRLSEMRRQRRGA